MPKAIDNNAPLASTIKDTSDNRDVNAPPENEPPSSVFSDVQSQTKAKPLLANIEQLDGGIKVVLNNPNVLIYNAYVETAEKNIDRRHLGNRFFLAFSGGLAAAIAFIFEGKIGSAARKISGEANQMSVIDMTLVTDIAVGLRLPLILLLFLFMATQLLWLGFIQAARRISKAKYNVIHKIEEEFLEFHPFKSEWEIIRPEKNTQSKESEAHKKDWKLLPQLNFTALETLLPSLLLAISCVVLVWLFVIGTPIFELSAGPN